jgi:DNA-binding LacI/PurR family transcriptional regulator
MDDVPRLRLYTHRMPKGPRAERRHARVDIRDVARRAGVSISTVSRVTNRKGTVNREMTDRVWRAVRELDYHPDVQARALVSGRSHIIGLMVTEITNPFFPELVQCFEKMAVEAGYEVLLASTPQDPASIARSVRRVLQRKVDGVAVMMFGREAAILEELSTHSVPLVVMDRAPSGMARSRIDAVQVNYDQGICEAVTHLVELGHRQIAFVSGPLEQASARLRRDAFEKGMRGRQIKVRADLMVEGDHTLEGGMAAIGALLARAQPPTAVVCSNDLTAIGVLHGVFEAGKQVPTDLSVIGFDDVHIAQFMLPPLTTVRMACADIAQVAFSTLRNRIEAPTTRHAAGPAAVPVETKLILRQTTAPLRQGDAAASPGRVSRARPQAT